MKNLARGGMKQLPKAPQREIGPGGGRKRKKGGPWGLIKAR
jgi:hypothetical protein